MKKPSDYLVAVKPTAHPGMREFKIYTRRLTDDLEIYDYPLNFRMLPDDIPRRYNHDHRKVEPLARQLHQLDGVVGVQVDGTKILVRIGHPGKWPEAQPKIIKVIQRYLILIYSKVDGR